MSGVGSSPALGTCETNQVLLADVPGGFSRGSPAFAHLLIGPSHMSWNNLEMDVKLNLKKNVLRVWFAEPINLVRRPNLCTLWLLSSTKMLYDYFLPISPFVSSFQYPRCNGQELQ